MSIHPVFKHIAQSMALALYASTTLADSIPASEFGKLPPIHSMSISPDGSKLVALRAKGDTYHAVVTDLVAQKSRLLLAADPEQFLFDWCRFANETRVICQIRKYGVITAALGQNQFYYDGRTIFSRLIAVDIDGSNVLQLVPPSKATGAGQGRKWNAINQSSVISWLPGDEKHILIQLAREDRLLPSVYRLNIYTNKLKRIRKYHSNVYQWTADREGKLVLASGINGAGEYLSYSVKGRRVAQLNINHLRGESPPLLLAVAEDGKSMWVIANYDSDTRGIHRLLLDDASVVETLFVDEKYDASALYLHPTLRYPVMSEYNSTTQSYRWADKDIEKQFTELKTVIPGRPSRVTVVGSDNAFNRLLLHTEGNSTHPSFYLYDRARGALTKIGSAYSSVGEIQQLESVSYTARDRVEIPAYLALPDKKIKGPFPTILLPHGGPWARDTDRFDYWVQFFLSRGYAVLKPNFRGSSGYGDAFMASGYKQWGLKMQDDLIDGLDWMVEQGYADPAQVCIIGGSYGGYAALVAAHKTPERFNCAVSFAGVADLNELNRQWRNYEAGAGFAAQRLQSGDERDQNSPILNADKIGIPLLIVHGDVDRRVMIEQSREFVKALEKAGKPHTYIEQKNGNHHLSLESHRIEFFEAMDGFLSKHLKQN